MRHTLIRLVSDYKRRALVLLTLISIAAASILPSALAQKVTPQTIQLIDLSTTTPSITYLGASADDHLSGNGNSDDPAIGRAHAIATGDFNNDGFADVLIGAPDADFTPDGGTLRGNAGAVYVSFGKATIVSPTTIDMNTAATVQPDVKIFGAAANDHVGFSVAAGDVNGDGVDDIVIGATGVDFPGVGQTPVPRADTGALIVILGSATLTPKTIDLAVANSASAIIYGERTGDLFGASVAIGAVGGTGTAADILAGAPANGGPDSGSLRANGGAAYLVFGGTNLNPVAAATKVIDLAGTDNPPNVKIFGKTGTKLGSSVAIGDINSGGTPDLIVGAPAANKPGVSELVEAGAVFAVFGGTNLNPPTGQAFKTFDVNTTQQNVSIYGAGAADHAGASISVADLTGDGVPDIAIGAPDADGRKDNREDSGEAYVIAGGTALNPPGASTERRIDISLSTVVLTLYGSDLGDHLGATVVATRINSFANTDTVADLLVGAPGFSPDTRTDAGAVYAIFGGASLLLFAERDLALGQDDLRVVGQAADDQLGWAIGAGDIDKNNATDLIVGAPFADVSAPAGARNAAGKVYVILASADFAPPVNQNPIVHVTAPNGGETIPGGSIFTITWTATDPNGDDTIQRFEITLFDLTHAGLGTIIASNLPGTARTFDWSVPIGVNINTARIEVVAFDNAGGQGQDQSDGNFTISDVGLTVTLAFPSGGEVLTFGQTFDIRWVVPPQAQSLLRGFDVFLSTDSGQTFPLPIAFSGPAAPALGPTARDFSWMVPRLCTTTARVSVVARLLNGSSTLDTSHSNFTIQEVGPTLDLTRVEVNGSFSKITLRTTAPAQGNEVDFVEGVKVELSDADRVQFFESSGVKFKSSGKKIQTKGTFNQQSLDQFFTDGSTRVLRVTNPTCGISLVTVHRVGGTLQVVTTDAARGVWQ
jgi:FG-GAP repeat protein